MACSSLIESGLWSRDAVERQMSHMERNSVRAAYIHKAEHLDAYSRWLFGCWRGNGLFPGYSASVHEESDRF